MSAEPAPSVDGDPITGGTLWRGIGPPKQAHASPPYKAGPAGVIFSDDAFYDPAAKHADDPNLWSLEVSFLWDALAGTPEQGLLDLQAAAPAKHFEALAGVTVAAVLSAAKVPTQDGHPNPAKAQGPGLRPMMVVMRPEATLAAHAVVTLREIWAAKPAWRLVRKALAALATDHHRNHGWVLAPAA